uniref:Uncharacterized protein n=1 Tax=Sphaerodactylus townsendi TaxID=933632 RepID=A0ACB8EH60_9SAUR
MPWRGADCGVVKGVRGVGWHSRQTSAFSSWPPQDLRTRILECNGRIPLCQHSSSVKKRLTPQVRGGDEVDEAAPPALPPQDGGSR